MVQLLIDEKSEILTLESAAFTDPGLARELNQDTVFHQTSQTAARGSVGLFIVCDGMGGRQGGEIASRMATDTITGELADIFSSPLVDSAKDQTRPSGYGLEKRVEQAILKANDKILNYARAHSRTTPKLGTTVTLALIIDNTALIANVGDGRAYAWRHGRLTQISRDHSVPALLAAKGIIQESEIAHHPSSNVILQAVGTETPLEVDFFSWPLQAGDKLLLCTDGLWKAIADPVELARCLASSTTAADLGQKLIHEAKKRDGSDNISVILICTGDDK